MRIEYPSGNKQTADMFSTLPYITTYCHTRLLHAFDTFFATGAWPQNLTKC
jgi:hypothetical protein